MFFGLLEIKIRLVQCFKLQLCIFYYFVCFVWIMVVVFFWEYQYDSIVLVEFKKKNVNDVCFFFILLDLIVEVKKNNYFLVECKIIRMINNYIFRLKITGKNGLLLEI